MSLPIAEVVSRLQDVLGATMVAYLGEVGDTRAVAQWMAGDHELCDAATSRLWMAYHAVALLGELGSQDVVQAWFWGEHPRLDDVAPARVLREQPLADAGPAVIAAARAFTTHG